jgi:hypothetical protein
VRDEGVGRGAKGAEEVEGRRRSAEPRSGVKRCFVVLTRAVTVKVLRWASRPEEESVCVYLFRVGVGVCEGGRDGAARGRTRASSTPSA